ncbi:Penicillin-binding protein 2D [Methylobrevis pamukkalensis]|uniref:Penicillin-binding protein 2D n=2 Tax=Methylobrevis pamukkalensis TaxID=1439726 RepID=A0A1E3H123_9HYPH|nr:Penicillin-binding protein 2D [Methylobrevis pamukkalensis]
MAEQGFITRRQEDAAIERPAEVVTAHVSRAENYVADWVMEQLPGYVGALDRDIRVETTIDVEAERAAEAVLRTVLAQKGRAAGISQGAIVAIADDGAVRALVGGRDYASSQFDRAVTRGASRAPPSSPSSSSPRWSAAGGRTAW